MGPHTSFQSCALKRTCSFSVRVWTDNVAFDKPHMCVSISGGTPVCVPTLDSFVGPHLIEDRHQQRNYYAVWESQCESPSEIVSSGIECAAIHTVHKLNSVAVNVTYAGLMTSVNQFPGCILDPNTLRIWFNTARYTSDDVFVPYEQRPDSQMLKICALSQGTRAHLAVETRVSSSPATQTTTVVTKMTDVWVWFSATSIAAPEIACTHGCGSTPWHWPGLLGVDSLQNRRPTETSVALLETSFDFQSRAGHQCEECLTTPCFQGHVDLDLMRCRDMCKATTGCDAYLFRPKEDNFTYAQCALCNGTMPAKYPLAMTRLSIRCLPTRGRLRNPRHASVAAGQR